MSIPLLGGEFGLGFYVSFGTLPEMEVVIMAG